MGRFLLIDLHALWVQSQVGGEVQFLFKIEGACPRRGGRGCLYLVGGGKIPTENLCVCWLHYYPILWSCICIAYVLQCQSSPMTEGR